MCELMGLSFARPISADFSIHEFALRSAENADGWGLAWYPDRSAALIKEPLAWSASKFTRFLETYEGLVSRTYIAHVRHRTTGGTPTRADTHPFLREWAGRDWCFAHNGTLEILGRGLPLGRFRPIGGTDSERAFCYLLAEIGARSTDRTPSIGQPGLNHSRLDNSKLDHSKLDYSKLDDDADWNWLHQRLARLNEFGKLNCIFSDGERLFCYHDRAGYKGMSRCRIHFRNNDARRFADATIGIDLEADRANHGFVIATRPLSKIGWEAFQPGELAIFDAGGLCYSSRRELAQAPAN
jgi:predicted glutamine amidotransferase